MRTTPQVGPELHEKKSSEFAAGKFDEKFGLPTSCHLLLKIFHLLQHFCRNFSHMKEYSWKSSQKKKRREAEQTRKKGKVKV